MTIRETVVTTWVVAVRRAKMVCMNLGLVALLLMAPQALRYLVKVAFNRGVRCGYRTACDRVFESIQGTNDLASLAEEMGEPMDIPTFTIMLAERLSLSLHADITLVFDSGDADEP
ncbi:MAG: hypothetical protein EBR40_11505 [Proteobacteria bacterium]|nr:hypothetical protein [Pseudomonadota bacterium]